MIDLTLAFFLLAPPLGQLPDAGAETTAGSISWPAGKEEVEPLEVALQADEPAPLEAAIRLERISTAVPWPRGMALVDGRIIVLARGRHRRAGGCDPAVEDFAGSLFVVNPDIAEPVRPGRSVSAAVRNNARLLARPTSPPFRLWDRRTPPLSDTRMGRPYCTLAYDSTSQNLFICAFSGVDLPGPRFRKNTTDAILRFDLRTRHWAAVENHARSSTAAPNNDSIAPNSLYPQHDPAHHAPPHGWLNGPDAAVVAGRFLYAAGKDNHTVAQYDLAAIRQDPGAGPPPSRSVLQGRARVELGGGAREIAALGPSAMAVHGDYLYVGFRTSSFILRLALTPDGDLRRPVLAEPIAQFEPWDPARKRSADLMDMAFNARGELFVSCAREGRVWNLGVPDPSRPFDGNDQRLAPPCPNRPFIDLPLLTGNPKAHTGNIAIDDQDRILVCSGNYDAGTEIAGVIYRATPMPR